MNNNSDQNRPSDHSNTANQTTDDNTILNTNTSHPLLPTTPLLHDQFAGDILNEAKEPNTTRIYAQNINGIKWDNDGGTWPMICETMSSIHADIACLTELNLDIHNHKLSTTMRRIERRFFKQSRFAGSTSTNKVPHTYEPGRTSMLVVNNMTATIKKIHKRQNGQMGHHPSCRQPRNPHCHHYSLSGMPKDYHRQCHSCQLPNRQAHRRRTHTKQHAKPPTRIHIRPLALHQTIATSRNEYYSCGRFQRRKRPRS